MKQSVRRWISATGVMTAVGAAGCGQGLAATAVAGPAVTRPGPAAYVPPGHDLFYGNKGAAVKSVQRRLAQLHYYPGPVDGVYGADMEQAVWAFKEVGPA